MYFLQEKIKIDHDRLEIRPIKPNEDDISKLDCTEEDGTDPRKVQNFLRTEALDYHRGKASTVYIVKEQQRDDILAFFALSMFGLEANRLGEDDKLASYDKRSYPAVLLGQIGVDKAYREHKLGQEICKFCVGLAATISEQIACRYIVLETDEKMARYFNKKCGFKQSVQPNKKRNVWMYRRLTREIVKVSVLDEIGIHESVSYRLTRVGDKEE
jgi:hypothetical protein